MQRLSLRVVDGYWTANPTVEGRRRTWTFGLASEVTESRARLDLEQRLNSPQTPHRSGCRVRKLAELFLDHAANVYVRDDGSQTGEASNILYAANPFSALFGKMPANEVKPRHLKLFADEQIKNDVSRQTINKRIGILKRMLMWGKNEELCPIAFDACRDFQPIRKGYMTAGGLVAREAKSVNAVPLPQVEQTLAMLPPTLQTMVRLQIATAMRPEEVCAMRLVDIDMSQEPWMYIPRWHKNKHRGHQRRIFMGPGARDLLAPYVKPGKMNREMFSPRVAVHERRGKYQKGVYHSYTTRSYRKAIWYACDRAFPMPEHFKEARRPAWIREHRWSPNRLRKLALDQIERTHGKQAAKACAGHSRVETTQEFYLSQDEVMARKVAESA